MPDLGRSTTAYVSGYQLDRVHQARMVRGATRQLVANFNGAIPAGSLIVSAIWRVLVPQSIYMSDAAISEDQRSTSVLIKAQIGCGTTVKCQVTLDTGEVYNQVYWLRVYTAPWFMGETSPPATGPYELTVTAP
jgi:hypothetical protein